MEPFCNLGAIIPDWVQEMAPKYLLSGLVSLTHGPGQGELR
jgi:hypothetical protein